MLQDAPSGRGRQFLDEASTRRSGSNSLGAVVADYAASGSQRKAGEGEVLGGGPGRRLSGLSGPCERRLSVPPAGMPVRASFNL